MSDAPTRASDVAIIGMACRFPGASSPEAFWQNLRAGVESIQRLSDDALLAAGVSRAQLDDPHYVKACPVLDDIDKFDAGFFGLSPRDASVMDPAHRLFLEVAYHALEHAGYAAKPEHGAVGVFAGSGAPLYFAANLCTNPQLLRSMGEFLVRHTGNDMNFLATRVSYELDLRGPSLNVQTACSSALVAVHLACQSLARGECTLALAGASTVLVPMGQGYEVREGEILSPDGHCRPFDAASAGTVFGSGTGCVVLKLLKDALDDGDTIHAVIKGSAINNDGSLKVGYLAPSIDGQAEVIASALRAAGLSARDIGYVEAHGTGTLVGDPIELTGLRQAFARFTPERQFCAIGSVKGNIGHLGEASGIASLIKAVLALKQRELPASLGYTAPNPQFDFAESPFFVNAQLRPWHAQGVRRCGVTALGAGGTNCHLILEEAPEAIAGEGGRDRQLLVLSAKSRAALERASVGLATHLTATREDLADVAYTLALGRRALPQRRVLVVESREDAIAQLQKPDAKQPAAPCEGKPGVVFMFPGGGAQYAGMGAELYASEPAYREAFDACLACVEPQLALTLRSLIFAQPAERAAATRQLERPSLSLPALFATEYALARLFQAWGVEAVGCIGHSMGEYVAACLAQVISLEQALQLVLLRGRLFETTQPGAMLSVALSEAELAALLPEGTSIAAINAPQLCVASGPLACIERLERELGARAVDVSRVRIDVAAHSPLLDPILDEFRALCRSIDWRVPSLPFVSNLTGRWIRPEEATDPEYWVRHLRGAVRFADCLETAFAAGERVLLELGPGRTLSTLARARPGGARAVNAMRHPQEQAHDLSYALHTLGRLWQYGADVDWSGFYAGELRNRVPLPGYPFERSSFWVEPGRASVASAPDELIKRRSMDDWFGAPTWTQSTLLASSSQAAGAATRWLVFSDGSALGARLAKRLGAHVIQVRPSHAGAALRQLGPRAWELDPSSSNQHRELLDALAEQGFRPDHVVYLLGLSPLAGVRQRWAGLDAALIPSFFAPTFLARALGRLGEPVELSVVTTGVAPIDAAPLVPLHATSLGPVRVAPREFPALRTRCIDLPARAFKRTSALEAALLAELWAAPSEPLVALRPSARWVASVAPIALEPSADASTFLAGAGLRDEGVYVFTGGLGGIALEVALQFAKAKRVRLALLARAELPPEQEWDALLASVSPDSRGAQRIRKLREIRALGSRVEVIGCDVVDPASVQGALARVRSELGPIHGVIHSAGLMDDEPMEERTVSAMRRVLEPKLHGTLNLDAALREPLDFFVLFSSIASTLGLPGQVDYTAANAFLDAFAHERARRAPGRTLVINWSAWRDVGMAALAQQVRQRGPLPSTPCAHPALDGYSDPRGEGRVFSTDFDIERHWLLSEHQIKGSFALLSGTSFVELVRAAFSVGRAPGPIEISDLGFLAPFQVAPGETRRLTLQLVPAGGAFEVSLRTAGADPRSPSHAVGDVRAYRGPRPEPRELSRIERRCRVEESPKDRFLAQCFVDFGPRWANLVRARYGEGEALLELCLDARFEADLEHYQLHPALLDMATGGAQRLIPGFVAQRDFYVPVAYGALRLFAPLPRHVFSHVRLRPERAAGTASFDVSITDATGQCLVEIERFQMKRVEAGSAMLAPRLGVASAAPLDTGRGDAELQRVLREAIAPDEGVQALARVLAQPALVQCIVSSVDLRVWERTLVAARPDAAQAGGGAEALGFSRPELRSEYEAPATASERLLAQLWSELLGVRQVGVLDDFFELGGNSLIAVRLFAAIKKHYSVSLPLSTLFEAPSIRPLAELLDANAPRTRPAAPAATRPPDKPGGYSSLVPMQLHGERPAFYCAAGMGGNPLNLRALALYVGMDQPFYGLQPQGLDGNSPVHDTIPDMASHYLGELRRKQPRGPYYLGGYSGGGVVAFEMARQLLAQGEEVGALVFLDSLAPVMPSRTQRERLGIHIERLRAQGAQYAVDTLLRRAEAELGQLVARARRPVARLFPYHFRLENITDAWLEASAAYRPEPYAGAAMLFRASSPSGLVSGTAIKLDEQNGWGPYVLGGVSVNECPGDHSTMCEEPNVRVLARRLRAYLDRRMAEPRREPPPAAPSREPPRERAIRAVAT